MISAVALTAVSAEADIPDRVTENSKIQASDYETMS